MQTRPAILPARPGIAQATDARVTAPGIRGSLRPGPGDATRPAGPRAPVPPTPPLASRTIHPGQGSRVQLQTRTLHRPPAPPVPYTLRDAEGSRRVAGRVVGAAGPMTFRSSYVIPFSGNRGA